MLERQAGLDAGVPGTWFQLVILDAATDATAGDLALHFRKDDPRQVELGINLDPARQGEGLATLAVRRVLELLFAMLAREWRDRPALAPDGPPL